MKLRLNLNLRKMLLACMAATVSLASGVADAAYLAEGVNYSSPTDSTRFYDTGKGYYFSWSIQYSFPELYELYKQKGGFQFLGDLYERMPANPANVQGHFKNLTDDSQTCWAQVSMNLVEYWHSYYGVFCKDSRELPYGYTYDRQYLDETGGTLSLKQNLIFLDTFSNTGDCLDSYLDWFMLGDDNPHFSNIEKTNQGGYWKDYFSETVWWASLSKGAWVSSLADFTKWLPSCLGFTKTGNSYTLTSKGQLVYLGLSGDYGVGHGITCHGFELGSNGQVNILYVTNSDDLEYKLFKLYVDESLRLYTNPACTEEWAYAGYSWYIDQVYAIDTPQVLKDMLAQYEDAENPLQWTGRKIKWEMQDESLIGQALPDESSGWQVAVDDEYYPIYNLDANRSVEFNDKASSGVVSVQGTVQAEQMLLSNNTLTYSFTGGAIQADSMRVTGGGKSLLTNIKASGSNLDLLNGQLELGSGAQLEYTQGSVGSAGVLSLDGGSAAFTGLTFNSGATLELISSSTLVSSTLSAQNGVNFLFSATDVVLTLEGTVSASAPINLQMVETATLNQKYAIITFETEQPDWALLYQSSSGLLEYNDKTLYLTYVPFGQLHWSGGSGSWTANQWGGISGSTDSKMVYFDAATGGTVNISGPVLPYAVTLTEGAYTFQPANQAARVQVTGGVVMSGSSTLTNNTPTTAAFLSLTGTAHYTAGADTSIGSLNTAERTMLSVGSGATVAVDSIEAVSGGISVAQNGALRLNAKGDATLGGDISGQGVLSFLGGHTFTLNDDSLTFSGRMEVGENTKLAMAGYNASSSFHLSSGSVLTLGASGDFSSKVSGTGTVSVAKDAEIRFLVEDGASSLGDSLQLDIKGQATMGASGNGVKEAQFLGNVTVSGSLDVWTNATPMQVATLDLQGGSVTFNDTNTRDGDYYQRTISRLNVGDAGGSLKAALDFGTYPMLKSVTDIDSLSGTGDLVIEGSTYMTLILHRIHSVAESGFTGNLTLYPCSCKVVVGGEYRKVILLELDEMELPGEVFIQTLDFNTEDEQGLSNSGLGINGDVTIGGLGNTDTTYGRVFLYSGHVEDSITDTKQTLDIPDYIQKAEHTLTIDSGSEHTFGGYVLGSLNLVKKGKGKQTFSGDMSAFDGSIDVQDGTLNIVNNVTAARMSICKSSFTGQGTVNTGSSLIMQDGKLSAGRLVASQASFSGCNSIFASSISADAWCLNLSSANISTPVLTLSSVSSFDVSDLTLEYNPEDMYVDSYKLISYESSLSMDDSFLDGIEGITRTSELSGGKEMITLVYYLADGKKLYKRDTAAVLTWLPASGSWEAEQGHFAGTWSSSASNRNFYNGDTVEFNQTAQVSLVGDLSPAEVNISHASGIVEFTGEGTIKGDAVIRKRGQGTLILRNAHSYTGGTWITGGMVQLHHADAMGTGAVELQNASLDMNHTWVKNSISVSGTSSILNGEYFGGSLSVQDGSLSGLVQLVSQALFQDAKVSAVLSGSGGVKLRGAVSLAGTNTYAGGTVLEDAELRISNASALGSGSISCSGESALLVDSGVTLALKSSIKNQGSLSLSGSWDASALSSTPLHQDHMSAEGVAGNSGFSISGGYSVQVVTGGSVQDSGVNLVHDGHTLILSENGTAIHPGQVDYSAYDVNEAENVSISDIRSVAGSHQSDITVNNGSVSMDADISGSLTLNGGELLFSGDVVSVAELLIIGSANVHLTLDNSYETGSSYTLLSAAGIEGNISHLRILSDSLHSQYVIRQVENAIVVDVTYKGATLAWKGGKGATWSTNGSSCWTAKGSAQAFSNGDEVIFDQSGSVTISGQVEPGAILIRANGNLTFKSDKKKPGSIAGNAVLKKQGSGALTLNDGNTSWTGDTYLQTGTIKVKGTTSLGKGDVYVQGGTLNLGSKAIANDIIQSKTAAIKSGKKFTGTYTLEGGELQKGSTLNISKTATLEGGSVNGTLTGTGTTTVTGNVKLGDKGKITTKALTLGEDATLTTSVKGLSSKTTTLSIGEDATLSLGGKMTVDSLKMNGGTLKTTASKPAAITVKNNMELTDAVLSTNGKVTTNKLTLNNSTMGIKGAKAQNLTVKQSLTIGSGSALTLNGKLSAGSLTIQKDGMLTMSGSKPVTLKVKGTLTLNEGSSIIMNYSFVQGKTYKVLTFGSYSGSKDYYSIFGVEADDCTITNTGKALTLTVTGKWKPQSQQKAVSADAATPIVAAKLQANPVADALVQANWGQLEASRAFVNAIANRSNATQLGNGERAVWASAIGSSSRHSSAGGHNGADTNVSGGAFGLETQAGRASLFGMALGNSWTRVSAHGFGTIEQDTTHLGVYGQTNWRSGISADWSAAYGRSESESMGSDWNQKHLQLDGRVSYNHELNARTVLSPFAGVQYYACDAAGIGTTDTGSLQNLRAEIGVSASHRTSKLGIFGEIALHQDIARNNPTVSMEGVRSTGMNSGRTGINFTIGASYELNAQWSVNASYTGEFVENANAHSANIGASYKF